MVRWTCAGALLLLAGCGHADQPEAVNVTDMNLTSETRPGVIATPTGRKAPGTVFTDDGVDTRAPTPGVPPPK
jgi:hypothetical protein